MKHKKIKLMIITHDMAIGGLQQVIVNLCRNLNRNIFEPSVLCLRRGGEFAMQIERLGIKLITLPQKNKTDYFSFLKVARILKREKIDIIHTHNTQPFIDGTMAALLSGVKTIIHTDHARSFPDKKRYMFLEWAMSHFAYKIVGVSEHTSENLLKYERISPKKLLTVLNGIDGERYDIMIDKIQKRRDLGINLDGPIIGLGVRLSDQKGISYLLKAIPDIIKKHPNLSVVIAGKGERSNQLISEANQLGINGKNVFFIGPRLDIPEIIKLFDIYVLPSVWEGLPMVLLEALASGCPIIATDVGGNSLAVKNNFNGILVRPKDSKQLSKKISSLLENNKLRKQFSINALQLFKEQFSAKKMTQEYENLYLKASGL